MGEALIVFLVYAGVGLTIWLGCHFGGKWVDRQLCVRPPLDPNKPIVLPHAMDRD